MRFGIPADSSRGGSQYSPRQIKSQDFRGPDFFVVRDTERKPRKSWVVWEEEGKYPNFIIELLWDSTAKVDEVHAVREARVHCTIEELATGSNCDRGQKKQIYQNTFRTPDYFWFDPHTLEFKGFHLVDGEYQDLHPNEQGLLWSQQLQLYLGIYEQQLRFFTTEGELVLTPEETAQATKALLEMEQQQKEKLAAKLRELGIDPDTVV